MLLLCTEIDARLGHANSRFGQVDPDTTRRSATRLIDTVSDFLGLMIVVLSSELEFGSAIDGYRHARNPSRIVPIEERCDRRNIVRLLDPFDRLNAKDERPALHTLCETGHVSLNDAQRDRVDADALLSEHRGEMLDQRYRPRLSKQHRPTTLRQPPSLVLLTSHWVPMGPAIRPKLNLGQKPCCSLIRVRILPQSIPSFWRVWL